MKIIIGITLIIILFVWIYSINGTIEKSKQACLKSCQAQFWVYSCQKECEGRYGK